MPTFVYLPKYEWCLLVVKPGTGFVSILDRWDGLEIWEADSMEEALEFLAKNLVDDES